jgi:CheY-like chemotaxis protein
LVRVTTTKKLVMRGYSASDADSPYKGLAILENETFDVVLTDLRMPGMDGLEFLTEVRERWPDTEVILMTAFGTVETAVDAMQRGAADFLTKPFKMEELDLRLGRLAELKSARAEVTRLRGLVADTKDNLGLVGSSPGIALVREIDASVPLRRQMAALCCSTTSTTCRLSCRSNCCACCRKGPSFGLVAPTKSASTCGWLRPPKSTSKARSRTPASGPTFSTGCVDWRCTYPRCGSAAATC